MYTEIYERWLRPKLFTMDPEDAHNRATEILEKVSRSRLLCFGLKTALQIKDKRLVRTRMGITFPNPVGLAAGFSKYGTGLPALKACGFGFLELGGVTPLPQDGNPQPRMFRLEEDYALINRMGLNNPGIEGLKNNLASSGALDIPIGINIGKGKDTSLERAEDDYCACLERLYTDADFFVLNISSPNTPGLRTLQNPEVLNRMLKAIMIKRMELSLRHRDRKPILVKIAPDLDLDMLDEIIRCVIQNGMNGMVVANTTTSRKGLTGKYKDEAGGLSGRLLFERCCTLVGYVKDKAPNLTVIASGGIFSAADAWRLIKYCKADLLQIYAGLVYKGPGLVREINKGLLNEMNNLGISSLENIK